MDKNAFWEEKYIKNISKIKGICYRYISDPQLAEDLAHDAFLTAIEKVDTYKGIGKFESWLKKIAINSALQFLRKQKLNKYHDEIKDIETEILEEDDINDINIIKNTDFSHEELLDTINSLPEHHRIVFNMYVIDGYSHIQISKMLGISIGTSKSHLARARKKIKKILYNKAIDKNEKSKKKNFLFMFLLTNNSKYIDTLYKDKFKSFEMLCNKAFLVDKVSCSSLTKFSTILMKNILIYSFAVIISVVSFFIVGKFFTKKNLNDNNSESKIYDTIKINDSIEHIYNVNTSKINKVKDTTQRYKPEIIRKTIVVKKTVLMRDTIKVLQDEDSTVNF